MHIVGSASIYIYICDFFHIGFIAIVSVCVFIMKFAGVCDKIKQYILALTCIYDRLFYNYIKQNDVIYQVNIYINGCKNAL